MGIAEIKWTTNKLYRLFAALTVKANGNLAILQTGETDMNGKMGLAKGHDIRAPVCITGLQKCCALRGSQIWEIGAAGVFRRVRSLHLL
jgi:hypothetical protein